MVVGWKLGSGFRVRGSGFGVRGSGGGFAAIIKGGDARKSAGSRFPVLNFPIIAHLTANDKDFSLRSK